MVDSKKIKEIHNILLGGEASKLVKTTPNYRSILKNLIEVSASLGIDLTEEDGVEKIVSSRQNTPYPNFPNKKEFEEGDFKP